MKNLNSVIANKDWETLLKSYTPSDLASNLTFIEALVLSRKILENEAWNDELQTYAIDLINAIRSKYPIDWNHDWRHDAYLGYAYDLRGWDHEEQYHAYNRAAEKCVSPNPEILMRIAMNWSCPGIYMKKNNEQKAITMLKKALSKTPYVEGVSCLIDLYNEVGDEEKKQHWEKILKESEKSQLYAPYEFLNIFEKYGW
ncbi:MAG: hypothetical protein K940chlam3_00882 [Chlamydiae bacterium]|nr:hypothetical protein [Chlamydiota bacterium]